MRKLQYILITVVCRSGHFRRLNGDYNPLHAVPEVGIGMGMGGVIIHGLFTWSTACYGVLNQCCSSDPARIKEIEARFSSPVRPGDRLVTEMWRTGAIDGHEEVVFRTVNQNGTVVLSNGRAILKLAGSESNL